MDLLNDDDNSTFDEFNIPPCQIERQRLAEYQANFTLEGLDAFNRTVITFEYLNAFPTSQAGTDFSFQSPNSNRSSFTFAYGQFRGGLSQTGIT